MFPRSQQRFALAMIVGLTLWMAPSPHSVSARPSTYQTFQCHFDASCPQVTIAGDPAATLGGSPAPFRGNGDPTIERDPATGTLWLAYSWLDVLVDGPVPPPVLNRGVQTHLARSDDGGATFTFVRAVNTAAMMNHPDTGVPGWAIHEVPTLVREAASAWQMQWLTYFAPYGDFPPGPTDNHSDFYFTKATAPSPASLGDTSQPWIDGAGTSPSFGAQYDLSALPQLSDCVAFTEPALFTQGGRTYLAANCVVVVGGVRRPDLERLVLLRQEASGYSYAGALLTYADAQDLGASRIEQADLAVARSGAVLLIATPIQEQSPQNLGCVVFQVTDLATATVLRDQNGHAVSLAKITGDPSDAMLGGGQCTYDAESTTGMLMVMHDVSNQIVFSVHATGVQPGAMADSCPEDLDLNLSETGGTGKVSFPDLLIFAAAYNATPSSLNWNPLADFDHSGKVAFPDLLRFAGHFNQTIAVCASNPP